MLVRILTRVGQATFVVAAEAGALLALALLIPGIDAGIADEPWVAGIILPALALGLLNAAVRPLLIAATIPMGVLGFGTITAGLNGLFLYAMHSSGFLAISSVSALLAGAIALAIINTVLTTILSIDEEDRFYRKVIRTRVSGLSVKRTNDPGLLIVEIDGLAHEYLQRARARQRVPALDALIRGDDITYQVWDCGIPSQTSSSQAGIMYGDSYDIPAFRWFERERGEIVVSGNARDAMAIEERISNGHGLLREGSSVNNLLSGDASRVALTLSDISRGSMSGKSRTGEILSFFLDPYCLTRALILVMWELLIQGIQSLWSAVRGHGLFAGHGAFYPLHRVLSTVVLRDLSTYLVVQDLISGSPSIYVSYIGYDVVAHQSGPSRAEAFGALATIDRQVGRLIDVARKHAPRPYHVVVLSDHGQSPGRSFRSRYGMSLARLVERLARGQQVGEQQTEHPRYLDALLKELELSEGMPALGRTRKRAIRRGRLYLAKRLEGDEVERLWPPDRRIEVLCSGNLAHIYLPGKDESFYLEEINEIYPDLVPGLLTHEGIGFLVVRSAGRGILVLGPHGLREIASGRVEGVDPLHLLPRPRTAATQLHRLGEFPHTGDIVVNSSVRQGSVASFEEQVGSHGGMGGPQNFPFLIAPKQIDTSGELIVSPEQIYDLLQRLRTPVEEPSAKSA
jgi:uncharacterized membrane protein YvlD (DUF360 family)